MTFLEPIYFVNVKQMDLIQIKRLWISWGANSYLQACYLEYFNLFGH